jgi:hypothetical protein
MIDEEKREFKNLAIEISARSSLARSKHKSSSIELSKSQECEDSEQFLREKKSVCEREHDSVTCSKALAEISNVQKERGTTY